MAKPVIDTVLLNARAIIANRRLRLLGAEAVTADGRECDACDDNAERFCAIGALIRAAYVMTGNHEQAHRLGWQPVLSPMLRTCGESTNTNPAGASLCSAIGAAKRRCCALLMRSATSAGTDLCATCTR
jgi:hypothetical protein